MLYQRFGQGVLNLSTVAELRTFDGMSPVTLCPQLGCALTFASEAKFEIEIKISFRLEAKKKPDFT